MVLEDKISRVNVAVLSRAESWRPEKFVQLYVDGEREPYLRFGEDALPTHRKTLREFIDVCREAGDSIISEEDYKKFIEQAEKTREAAFFPVELGRYQAVGMGSAYIDQENHVILFEGSSQDYGLRPNWEHLKQITAYLPDWKLEVRE